MADCLRHITPTRPPLLHTYATLAIHIGYVTDEVIRPLIAADTRHTLRPYYAPHTLNSYH